MDRTEIVSAGIADGAPALPRLEVAKRSNTLHCCMFPVAIPNCARPVICGCVSLRFIENVSQFHFFDVHVPAGGNAS
jgi:hypothetical protein